MKQPTLFDIRPTGHGAERIHVPAQGNNPHGQEAAAKLGRTGIPQRQVDQLLERLARVDRLTRGMLCALTNIKESSVCARLNEMVHQGLVYVCGETRGVYGTMVNVYAITEAGRERLMT